MKNYKRKVNFSSQNYFCKDTKKNKISRNEKDFFSLKEIRTCFEFLQQFASSGVFVFLILFWLSFANPFAQIARYLSLND